MNREVTSLPHPACSTSQSSGSDVVSDVVSDVTNKKVPTDHTVDSEGSDPVGLFVNVKINNVQCVALIDTGASVSIINMNLAKNINVNNKFRLQIAGGDDLLTQGSCVASVTLNGRTVLHNFHVLNNAVNNVSCILGLDYISSNDVSIYGGSSRSPILTVGGEVVELLKKGKSISVNNVRVFEEGFLGRLTNTVEVPGNCIFNISVRVNENIPEGEKVLVTPFAKYEGFVCEGVSEVKKGMVTVPVINLSSVIFKMEPQAMCHISVVEVCADAPPGGSRSRSLPKELERGQMLPCQTDAGRVQRIIDVTLPSTDLAYHGVMKELVRKYSDVIAVGDEPPGRIKSFPFRIDTGNAEPIRSRPYKIPHSKEEVVKKEISKLLQEGIIRPSCSPWSSPIVLVKKKDSTMRMCVDFRKLNAVTKEDLFPLPAIEDLLAKVRNTKFFSTLDLKSGYHQVPVEEKDREKTAFIVADGLFEFAYLPFGLKNAPAHFSRVMMSILAGLIGTSVLVYLDDLIILGSTFEEHLGNLLKVLEAFRRHGIKLKIEKCQFFKSEVEFLGHKVTREGLKPCVDKVEAIKGFPVPKTGKEVASFLGMCGYYRKFIKGFGEIARPLQVLRNSNEFVWGEAEDRAFRELKDALTGNEVLAYPKFDRAFIVTTDASREGLGGVISQIGDDGKERPVCFASRSLQKAELNYSVLEKEALAILWMLERHRYMLLGHDILLRSDHRPLRDLFAQDCKNARQFRWIERLLEFRIVNVDHVKGKDNVVADCLSRRRGECNVMTRSKA